jgi:hypothetical protein
MRRPILNKLTRYLRLSEKSSNSWTRQATWRNKYAKEQRDFINGVVKPEENRKSAWL